MGGFCVRRWHNCVGAANSASCNGGGIYMSGNGLVSNAVVSLNDAVYAIPFGGGVYATAGIITHSMIASNLTESSGNSYGGTGQTPSGGGVYLAGTAQLHNSIVFGNRAVHSYQYRMGETLGAGVFISASAKVYHSTIVGNYGGERGYGDGVYISGGELKNSIVSHNFSGFDSGDYTVNHYNVWQAGGTVSYNVLPRSHLIAPGVGNVAADPGFVNVYAGDLSLGPGSPAIDAATVIAGMDSDFSGVARPLNGSDAESALPDMGALEAQPLDAGPLRINFTVAQEDGFDSLSAALQAHVAGESLGSLVYHWDFDGDGVADITGSDKATVSHLFDTVGYHDIGLKVVSSGAGEATIVKRAAARVHPSVLYLSDAGTSEAPYNTPDKASATLQDIVNWADDNAEIRVAPGAYKITTKPVTLRRGIKVVGSDNTTTAIERAPASTTRLFIMAHAGAELSNLTLRTAIGQKAGIGLRRGGVDVERVDRSLHRDQQQRSRPTQPAGTRRCYLYVGRNRAQLLDQPQFEWVEQLRLARRRRLYVGWPD